MGFTVVPLAQKARTATLIADSDLNLGIYDLIATDVKGDTAEFTEFVGGVGNFSNVLGSGNLDIEGTGNIKGLTTFQNAVQVNGALHVEGSINNVNIADNGEITTAQGVNGADFNGAKITSTKFNGATINTSGDYSGRKGTFSGAVTGASFNGVTLGENLFNGRRIRPIVNTNTGGEHLTNLSTTPQVIVLIAPYISTANGTYKIAPPLLNDFKTPVYDIPSNVNYELRFTANAALTLTINLTGNITKTVSFNNVTTATTSLTYAQALAFARDGCTLTISGNSGSAAVLNQIALRATINSGTKRVFVHF